MEHLIRLSKVNTTPGFPLKASTLYKWKHTRKYSDLFVKLGGAVFVDTRRLEKIIEAGRG